MQSIDFLSPNIIATILSYLTPFFITFLLGLIGSIIVSLVQIRALSDIFKQKNETLGECVNSAFHNFGRYLLTSLATFFYVTKIPLAFFIGAGTLFFIGAVGHNKGLTFLGVTLLSISIVIFIVFTITRCPRVFAALYIAVDQNQTPSHALHSSLNLTEKKWGDIFLNLLLFGLLWGGSIFVVGWILSIIINAIPMVNEAVQTFRAETTDELMKTVETASRTKIISLHNIVNELLSTFLKVIQQSVAVVFGFILYKWLQIRKRNNQSHSQQTMVPSSQ